MKNITLVTLLLSACLANAQERVVPADQDQFQKAGDFHWIDSKVTHALANNGREAGIVVEVELK